MTKQIRGKLHDHAMKDCETLIKGEEGKHIAGVVFIVPYLGNTRGRIYQKAFRQKRLDDFITCIRSLTDLDADFIAYHVRAPAHTEKFFEKYRRWVKDGEEKDGPYWEPAIAVVGKYLRKN